MISIYWNSPRRITTFRKWLASRWSWTARGLPHDGMKPGTICGGYRLFGLSLYYSFPPRKEVGR